MNDPKPFFLSGNQTGVLLIHGFTGAPAEMRLVGDYLHERGYTVHAPLLPGHGTTAADLNCRRWPEWVEAVTAALRHLQQSCSAVFVGGLSLGSVLTLYLAAHEPNLSGIILYSPAMGIGDWRSRFLGIAKYVIKTQAKGSEFFGDPAAVNRLWCYDQYPTAAAHEVQKLIRLVRGLLSRVTCPTLIVHSTLDTAVIPHSANIVYAGIGATDKEMLTLHHSGHALTVDGEWAEVAARSCAFIQRLAGEAKPGVVQSIYTI